MTSKYDNYDAKAAERQRLHEAQWAAELDRVDDDTADIIEICVTGGQGFLTLAA